MIEIDPLIDYSKEQRRAIAFIDMKSFYASVECVERGLNPLSTSLCVMSGADNSAGLILASSPTFKKVFGKNNVGRSRDLPFYTHNRKFNYQNYYRTAPRDWLNKVTPPSKSEVAFIESWAKRTEIVPPRMSKYIEKNIEIQHAIQNFASPEDIFWYSIDEGFVDLTSSLNYFYDKALPAEVKLDKLSKEIQLAILNQTGIYSTVGMSIGNPLLAKLALDNEAKHNGNMRALWTYENIPDKVWKIKSLTDFWGINTRTEKRLNKLGIKSVYDLAHCNPALLKKEFGVVGVQLFFHANGVDESTVYEPYHAKSKSIGNSQVLPRDYADQTQIELVIKEMTEQVSIRLRKAKKQTTVVSLYIGFSYSENKKGLHVQKKIEVTNSIAVLSDQIMSLFRAGYSGGSVRRLGISFGGLCSEEVKLISLFETFDKKAAKTETLQGAIDEIRNQYGFLALQKATSLLDGSRVVARSKLVGGHSAGGLDGLK